MAKAHERIADMRLYFLRKTATMIGETQTIAVAEDMQIRGMTRRARGTKEVRTEPLHLSRLCGVLSERGGRYRRIR